MTFRPSNPIGPFRRHLQRDNRRGGYSPSLGLFPVGEPFVSGAVRFDGASYFKRLGKLGGAVDHNTVSLSLWVRPEAMSAGATYVLCFGLDLDSNDSWLLYYSDSIVGFQYVNGPSTSLYFFTSTAGALPVNTPALVQMRVIVGSAPQLYVNGVNRYDAATLQNTGMGTMRWTFDQWTIGSDGLTWHAVASMADLWIAPTQSVDFSVAANRNKFGTTRPAPIGNDGSLVTGVRPLLYHRVPRGENPGRYQLNRARTGDFLDRVGAPSLSNWIPGY